MDGGPSWPWSGWAGGSAPSCGCLVGVSIAVSAVEILPVEAERGRRTRDSGASSPGKWDAVAGLQRGFLDACHLPRRPETGEIESTGFLKSRRKGNSIRET